MTQDATIESNGSYLRVLGSSGGFPAMGLPCSGYLLVANQRKILFDCGPGVACALLQHSENCDLDAVCISHVHPDHILDLVPLAYSLMTQWVSEGRTVPLPVYMPTGGRALLERLSGLFGHRQW